MENVPKEIHICRYDLIINKGHRVNVYEIDDTKNCGNYHKGKCRLDNRKCVDYVWILKNCSDRNNKSSKKKTRKGLKEEKKYETHDR